MNMEGQHPRGPCRYGAACQNIGKCRFCHGAEGTAGGATGVLLESSSEDSDDEDEFILDAIAQFKMVDDDEDEFILDAIAQFKTVDAEEKLRRDVYAMGRHDGDEEDDDDDISGNGDDNKKAAASGSNDNINNGDCNNADDDEFHDEELGSVNSFDYDSDDYDGPDWEKDPHSPVEEGDIENKEDRIAFIGTDIDKENYFEDILPMIRDDDGIHGFYLYGKYRISYEAWTRLGEILGRKKHLREIRIGSCNLSADSIELLFGSGPFHKKTMKCLILGRNPTIGWQGVTALIPFFKKAPSLQWLDLHETNMGPKGLKLLSLGLNELPSLTHLELGNNNIGDEGLEGISILCFLKLIYLNLKGNGIGRRGCEVIANLLRSDESSLVSLDLGAWGLEGNAIDDECAEILATSLSHNTNLKSLRLVGNENISHVGWEYFHRLVCDTSSMSATYGSNHTLQTFNPDIVHRGANSRMGTLKDKACQKIIDRHFEKGNNPGPLMDMDAKLMPRVFSWINQRTDEDFGDGSRINFVYQILRTSNVRAFVRNDIAPPT